MRLSHVQRIDHCLQLMQNFYQLVIYSLIKIAIGYMLWATSPCIWTWHLWQLKIDCLIKISQTEKARLLKKLIVEFPARRWKLQMLFALLRILESTVFTKRLSGRPSDRRRSEWTDSNIKSTNNLSCNQDRQTTRSLILRVEMFSVNFVTFAFCKLFFRHDSLQNIVGIDAF